MEDWRSCEGHRALKVRGTAAVTDIRSGALLCDLGWPFRGGIVLSGRQAGRPPSVLNKQPASQVFTHWTRVARDAFFISVPFPQSGHGSLSLFSGDHCVMQPRCPWQLGPEAHTMCQQGGFLVSLCSCHNFCMRMCRLWVSLTSHTR